MSAEWTPVPSYCGPIQCDCCNARAEYFRDSHGNQTNTDYVTYQCRRHAEMSGLVVAGIVATGPREGTASVEVPL